MIGQEHDFTRHEDSSIAIPFGKGRVTSDSPIGKISLNFLAGPCSGRLQMRCTGARLLLGREEDCDVVLDGDTVSRRHCEIVRWGAAYLLRDQSRNGTFLNGERVHQAQLNDGDQIRIGQNLLAVELTSGSATQAVTGKMTTPQRTPPVLELKPHIVIKGLEEGVTQSFGEEKITLGRRAGNQIVIEAENISRNHTAIERRGEQYIVCDLDSANGTYLNEQRIDTAPLNDGDRLRIGNFAITVTLLNQDCILNFKKTTR